MSEEELRAVMDVHFYGTVHSLQQGRGGVLVTTVSAAHFGNFGQANYAAAKGAIASLTYTVARSSCRTTTRNSTARC